MRKQSAEARLASIKRFSDAGVSMGKIHKEREREEFERTGHSCYGEGWAAGFAQAMNIINEYVSRELAELEEEGAA